MLSDIRQALRQMAAHPGYTLVTVLTLALGIGANTAIFSMARGVLMRPLPYAHGAEMVHLLPHVSGTIGDQLYFPVLEVADYRKGNHTFSAVGEYHSMTFNLLGEGEPDRVQTGVVSANYFRAFGVTPVLGRDFRPDDDAVGANPVLLLSYDYWQDRFGGDPKVVGQRLRMNNRAIEVIGVLPRLPAYPGNDRVFMPTSSCPFRSSESTKTNRNVRMVSMWAQLRPGVTVQQAQADVKTIAASEQAAFPTASTAGMQVDLVKVSDELTSKFRPTLFILLGTSALVLLLACANAANLTFARLLSREREVVVRAALGASRGRLVRQLLTESVLTSLIGGVLGCLLAVLGLDLLVSFAHRFTPRAEEIRVDGVVLLFSLGLSLLAGLASGWLPAVQALRHNMAASLKEGAGRSTATAGKRRFRDLMVAAQVGVSLVLLIGAGLMVRSLVRLVEVDPGFRPERVLTATLDLPFSKYPPGGPQIANFFQRLTTELSGDPSVVSAAVASDVPMAESDLDTPDYKVEGQPTPPGQPAPRADVHITSEQYFPTLGIPLREGRLFSSQDRIGAPSVIIINRSMAKQWWPNRSPIGQRIAISWARHPEMRTVVGVVADVLHEGLAAKSHPTIYVPFLQLPGGGSQIFVRTRSDPARFLTTLRATVASIDAEQPVANIRTLEQVRSTALAPTRLIASLLSLFAALALAITGIGIGAAVSFAVGERLSEMAIRMALGADGGTVLSLLFKRAMGPVFVGLAVGLGAALALTRILASDLMNIGLFGVGTTDPFAVSASIVVLLAIGVVTCFLPSRRAARVDPASVLRQ
jgi:putative ABC transport system permease protein